MTLDEQREIAEWCGWRWWCPTDRYRADNSSTYRYRFLYPPKATPGAASMFRLCGARSGADWLLPGLEVHHELPLYDDLNSCAEFERVAEERGLGLTYAYQLMLLLRGHDLRPSENSIDWSTLEPDAITRLVVKATPEQRCAAILAVIREAKA